MANPLKKLQGKTIKSAEINATESSDSCWYASLVLEFTDGSEYSFRINAQPQVNGQFFKSEADKDAEEEVELVKP